MAGSFRLDQKEAHRPGSAGNARPKRNREGADGVGGGKNISRSMVPRFDRWPPGDHKITARGTTESSALCHELQPGISGGSPLCNFVSEREPGAPDSAELPGGRGVRRTRNVANVATACTARRGPAMR